MDGDTVRMVVGVGDKENPNWGGCTADMGSDLYWASFQFREKLPDDVVVDEQAAYDPAHSETETATDRRENYADRPALSGMDRQQLLAIVLTVLMIGSSLVYSFSLF